MLNIWQGGKGVDFQFNFWWNNEPGFLLSHAFFFTSCSIPACFREYCSKQWMWTEKRTFPWWLRGIVWIYLNRLPALGFSSGFHQHRSIPSVWAVLPGSPKGGEAKTEMGWKQEDPWSHQLPVTQIRDLYIHYLLNGTKNTTFGSLSSIRRCL